MRVVYCGLKVICFIRVLKLVCSDSNAGFREYRRVQKSSAQEYQTEFTSRLPSHHPSVITGHVITSHVMTGHLVTGHVVLGHVMTGHVVLLLALLVEVGVDQGTAFRLTGGWIHLLLVTGKLQTH